MTCVVIQGKRTHSDYLVLINFQVASQKGADVAIAQIFFVDNGVVCTTCNKFVRKRVDVVLPTLKPSLPIGLREGSRRASRGAFGVGVVKVDNTWQSGRSVAQPY